MALSYAYVALIRALAKNGSLTEDQLLPELAGATGQLQRIGETGAAELLGSFCENLQGVWD